VTETAEPQAIPANFGEVEKNFALHLPGYEPRLPQQRMATAIEAALAKGESLYVQAGCGTGKSLGGVTPALIQALHQGKRIIVATATKALQEQYANKDIPFLQEKSGIPFTWAVGARSARSAWRRRPSARAWTATW
jgi:Rad3-related DNA helicase